MNKLFAPIIALAVLIGIAPALALNDTIGVTAGSGKTANLIKFGSNSVISEVGICDATTENQCATVKAGSIAAGTTDAALVVQDATLHNDMVTLNNSVNAPIGAGTNIIGKLGIDQTTPGTTNGVALVGVNAATALAGAGAVGAGSARVAVGQDTTTIAGSAPGTVGTPSTNVVTIQENSADPCRNQTATIKPFSITTATTTNILTGTSGKKIYVCYLYMQTAGPNNIAVIEGTTGATCGAGTAALVGGTTAANGLNDSANGGQAFGNGGFSVMQTQTNNNDICIITSAGTSLAGVLKYALQ